MENIIHTFIGAILVSVMLTLIFLAFYAEIKQIGKEDRHARMVASSEVIKRGHRRWK